jgi:hypothetical protein
MFRTLSVLLRQCGVCHAALTLWRDTSAAVDTLHSFTETIGPDASYPTVDMTKLSNGEGSDGDVPGLKTQMLPDNGVLWNLDRIDQHNLPLNRKYT